MIAMHRRSFILHSAILWLGLALGGVGPAGAAEGAAPEVVIQAVGDCYLGGRRGAGLLAERGSAYPFAPTRALLAEGDVNIANLEGPLTGRGRPWLEKRFHFRMPPAVADALRAAGFHAVSLANNHLMDYGPVGLTDTLARLEATGIAHAGAGQDLAAARAPALIAVRGVTVALLSYTTTYPQEFYATRKRPGTVFPYEEYLARDLPAARARADVVVVAFHWGPERSHHALGHQEKLAHRVIDLGADLVIGHHPHVLQAVEWYRDRPIFYSLGNYAFASTAPGVKRAGLARVRFRVAGAGAEPVVVALLPLNVAWAETTAAPVPLTGERGARTIALVDRVSRPRGTTLRWQGDRGIAVPLPRGPGGS